LKKLGPQVNHGKKGILIQAPIQYHYTTTTEKAEERQDDDNTVTLTRLSGFKTAHVFDINQTDGPDLPEFATVQGNPGENLERLKTAIHKRSITLEYTDEMGRDQDSGISLPESIDRIEKSHSESSARAPLNQIPVPRLKGGS
jgi:hypothetical protein